MFPEPTELPLFGHSIESNWNPKSKSNTLTPKNQLADILTKGNFTRDEWNHLLTLFNINHFSSVRCSEVMSKRTQKDAGEERVTTKSKPMMNLVSRCSERNPDVLAFTASESRGNQIWKSKTLELVDRAASENGETCKRRLFIKLLRMDYWHEMVFSRVGIWWNVEHNDRVRKILDHAMQDSNKHSFIWWMFMSSTLQASVFMRKEYSEHLRSIKNTGNNLTNDISENLIVGQSDEIYGVTSINWKILHGNNYLWLVMKKSSVSRTRRFTYFQILCYALERCTRTHKLNTVWEDKLTWFKSSSQYRTLDTIDGEPMEFEWNVFPGFTTLKFCNKVQEFMSKMSDTP